MPEFFKPLLTARGFIPHGHCYLWKPDLVWLHVVSDSLIGLAYYSIPFMLVYFVHKRRDVPFDWIFLMFSSFIVACGTTHLLEVWTLWHPTYWLSGFVKAFTALVSVATAVLLGQLMPKALILPSPAQLEAANLALRNEITQRKLAEEALYRREQEFKALVENTPDVITRYDRELRSLYVNPAMEWETGIPPQEFIGKTLLETGFPEELAQLWESWFKEVFATGEMSLKEFNYLGPKGLKFYQARIVPEFAVNGLVESVFTVVRDITKLKQAEETLKQANEELEIRVTERTAELAKINECLQAEIAERKRVEEALLRRGGQLEILSRASRQINAVLEIPAVMRTLIASAVELVGVMAGTYGLMSQGKMVFTEYNENGNVRPIAETFERGIGVPGWVMETLQPYVANDAEHDSHVLPHLQKAFGFYNLVNLPIFNRKGELLGCFELHNKAERRPFSDNDITMLQGLANSAAVALENSQMLVERQQVEEALRLSEQRFRAIFNQAAVGIAQVGLDGQWLLVNQKLCDIVGYTREELLERSFQDITHPDDLAADRAYVRQILAGEIETYSIEKRYIRKDGYHVWINLNVSLVSNSSGEPQYFIAVIKDISDRKRAENALKSLVAGTAAVTGGEFFSALVQHLAAALGVRYALVTEGVGEPIGKARTLAFWAGDNQGENFEYDIANTPCEIVTNHRRICCYPDGVQALFPQDLDLVAMQAVCYLGVPLFDTSQQLIGLLCVLDDKPLAEEQRAQSILSIFAARAAAELERKRTEEGLQQSEERLRLALRATRLGTWDWNVLSKTLTWSDNVESIFGLAPGSFKGTYKAFLECIHPEDRDKVAQLLVQAFEQPQTSEWEKEYRIVCPDGTIRWLSSSGQYFYNETDQLIRMLGTCWDITERKRVEQEIRELNEQLERRVVERTAQLEAANKELEAFSYSVSHDLRAPLRHIDGFSKALLERYADKLDDKGKHYLQRIRVGTQRMGELIDDLLTLSRMTRSEMHRTKVDLSAIALNIATELSQTQPERQVEFAIAPGLIADGDARLLTIVLENLLNNAWKFTSNRVDSQIEFGVILHEEAKIVYFLRDNGAGFDMTYANKLFGAFGRLHTAAQFPGTGIGLATVQRIIHRHGGRVWAEGAVEQGATFYFTL